MALERITTNTPTAFDPSSDAMVKAMVKKVSEARGPGWEVESFDPETRKLTFVRGTALTEVSTTEGMKSIDVRLASDTRASDGDKIAQRLEETHQGFFLSQFRPHVGIATLTRMTEAELRCRDAVANVIGVPRWEVQVKARKGGGFTLSLPSKYDPAKHEKGLQNVAEAVVGRFGWYVDIDARTLKGEIVSAEPPTFEPVYPYDFDAISAGGPTSEDQSWKLPLGVALGGNGDENTPVDIDLTDTVGSLIVGLAGSGKSVSTQGLLFSALARGWRIALINTADKATDFMWAKPYVADNMWGCDSVAQAVAVAKLVIQEGSRLGELLSTYGASKWQDLPEQVRKENPRLLLVADELATLLTADPIPAGLSKEMKELPEFMKMQQDLLESKLLATALSTIPAVYRAAGIRLIYLTQQPNERYGFSTKLKGNLPHRIMLGTSPSDAEKGHAFRTPEKVPNVPTHIAQNDTIARGVGLAHLDGSEPVVFKGYFAPLATYIEQCQVRGMRRTLSPEPSAQQVRKLVPRLNEDPDEEPEGYGRGPRTYEAWEIGPDGTPLTGFERANAAKHHATVIAKQAESTPVS